MSATGHEHREVVARWQRAALILGCAALLIAIVGAVFDPPQFLRAYLATYTFFLGISLGGMAIVMLYQLTGGAWGLLVSRILEAEMGTLPLIAVLFLPIALGIEYLYPWAQPALVAKEPKLQYQQFYLEPGYFWCRAAAYFVLWLGTFVLLARWLRKRERTGEPRLIPQLATFSGIGLVLYGITLHFASIDWLMSLVPAFPSTIFPPLVASGQILSAFALVVVVLASMTDRPPLAEVVSLKALTDLGNLLLAMLAIWSYMAWFQFMLVWIANLPDDVVWYLPLGRGGWLWVAMALLVFQFTVPFFLLLFRSVKQNPRVLGGVATLIVFMQLVFAYYQVMPRFPSTSIARHWLDPFVSLGIGGIWLAYFLWRWTAWPVLPQHDTNMEQARELRRRDEEELAREESLVHG